MGGPLLSNEACTDGDSRAGSQARDPSLCEVLRAWAGCRAGEPVPRGLGKSVRDRPQEHPGGHSPALQEPGEESPSARSSWEDRTLPGSLPLLSPLWP